MADHDAVLRGHCAMDVKMDVKKPLQ